MILVGEKGGGKHSLCKYFSERVHYEIEDITETVSFELIEEIYTRVFPKIYIIDISCFALNKQNVILKFLEEPLKNAYIILLAPTLNNVLDTVINRCIVLELAPYTVETLEQFVTTDKNVDILLTLAKTPWQVMEYQQYDYFGIYQFAYKLLDKIGIANIGNILFNLEGYIAFKDEKDKYNFNIVVKALYAVAMQMAKDNKEFTTKKAFRLTRQLYLDSQNQSLNKETLFEKYLIDLKKSVVA